MVSLRAVIRALRRGVARLVNARQAKDATRRRAARREREMARRRAVHLPDTEAVQALFASRERPADPNDLVAYAYQILSQRGEDGIVNEILTRAGFPTRRSVEIGCGENGGNSGLLAACFGYRSLMVDGNAEELEILARLLAERSVTAVHAWVTAENIDELITSHGFAGEVDHFGLDLDGIDYWVWNAMTACDPLLVVAEYNPILGPTVAATIAYDSSFDRRDSTSGGRRKWPTGYHGVSLAGLVTLGRRRGYRLVATSPEHTPNAFFLKEGVCSELRTLTAEEAWRLRTKGKLKELYRQIQQVGVLCYFENASTPLVQVDE